MNLSSLYKMIDSIWLTKIFYNFNAFQIFLIVSSIYRNNFRVPYRIHIQNLLIIITHIIDRLDFIFSSFIIIHSWLCCWHADCTRLIVTYININITSKVCSNFTYSSSYFLNIFYYSAVYIIDFVSVCLL